MDSNLTILVLDAMLYLVTLIYWHGKKGWRNAGVFVWLVMAVSHAGTILYYQVLTMLGDVIEVNVMALAYLYMSIWISLYPFLSNGGVGRLDVGGDEKWIRLFSWAVILLNVEPLLENVYLLFHSSGVDYGEVYADRRNEGLMILSYVGSKLMRGVGHARIFATVSFFYFCTRKGNRFLKWGLGLVLANLFLYGINIGSRGDLMVQAFLYYCCFLLMRPLFPKDFLRKARKSALLLIIPLAAYFMVITVARYDYRNNNKTLAGWLLLYTSEGSIKFSNEMWEGRHNTEGDVNLCFLKDMLGLKTYTTFNDRDGHYLAKNGRRIEVFYTYVGDFVSDFGRGGGLAATAGLSLLSIALYGRRKAMSIPRLMMLLVLVHLYSIGFASNVYRAYGLQKTVFLTALLAVGLSAARSASFSSKGVKRLSDAVDKEELPV